MRGQKDDLNIKGAFMHMAADAAVSSGVVVGGLLIYLTGIQWIDPVMSCIIIGVILWGTLRLFADSINLALDAVPKHIELEKVYNFILSQNGVEGIHDLHVWAMSTTQTALTAHLIMPKGSSNEFISNLQEKLKHEFGIGHTTLQIENELIEKGCKTDC
jgi:cobalt-zinc-cadmium efflux system protein